MVDFTHDWLLKWVVGHDGDLRTPSLSSAQLWILNKSMASDWTPEPLANEKHFWELPTHLPSLQSSRLFLAPQLHLCPSATIFHFHSISHPLPYTHHTYACARTRMCVPRSCFPSVPCRVTVPIASACSVFKIWAGDNMQEVHCNQENKPRSRML